MPSRSHRANTVLVGFARALAYEEKEDYERAMDDSSVALKLTPNEADALFLRSLGRTRKGDKAGAEADMAEAKRINPNIGK